MKFIAIFTAIFLSTSILSACGGLLPSSNSPSTTIATATEAVSASQVKATSSVATPTNSSISAADSSIDSSIHSPDFVDSSLPSLTLDSNLVFRILSAELAFQRKQWQVAYILLMEVAQETRDPRIARRAAEIALVEKQSADALGAVQLWHELAPNSEEAAQYYLSLIVLSDQPKKAKTMLAQRLVSAATREERSAAIYQVQALLARAKDKKAAFSMLEELLAPYQTTFEIEVDCALALAAHAQGDSKRAQTEVHTALLKKPDSELAILTLVQVTPDPQIALQALSDFLQKYPNATTVRITYARLLFSQKQYSKAESEFTTLLKTQTTQTQDATTLYMLGALALQNKQPEKAEKYLTRYLKQLQITPNDALDTTQVLLILGQISEERGDINTALEWLNQINVENVENDQNQNVSYFSVQLKRAQLIAKSGNVEQAQKLIHEITTKTKLEQAQAILVESQILRDAQKWQEAYNILETSLQQFPDNVELLYEYAMINEKLAKLEAMEAALYKILKIVPDNYHAYNALGYSLAERNIRLEEAQALLGQALKLAPEDPYIMDSMGWLQFRLGNWKEAEKLLRQAYTLRPDAEIAIHLGEVLWVQGQKSEAQKLWRKVDIKTPQNTILKNTLMRLQAWI